MAHHRYILSWSRRQVNAYQSTTYKNLVRTSLANRYDRREMFALGQT